MINSLFVASAIIALGVALCPLLLVILLGWFLRLIFTSLNNSIVKRRIWHSTPCPNCDYFADSQELKCAVNPCLVLTKNAVNCRDFEPIVSYKARRA